jgi:hypothetical protein
VWAASRNDGAIRVGGLVLTVLYAALIGWLFTRQPQTVAQITGGLASTIGAYSIDQQSLADGLRFFRNDQFAEARMAFARADPAIRDARTQFYVAYAFYREGWGRFHHDDALYRQGIVAANRALALSPQGTYLVDDPSLVMRTAAELKAELEKGVEQTWSDLNALRVLEPRK